MASQPSSDKRNDASSARPSPSGGANSDNQPRKRVFSKELRNMMYGFGDDSQPYAESVELLEDLVVQYITDMTLQAAEIGSNKQGRMVVNDILYLLRHDPRKYARVKELLSMNEELKRARKAFDEPSKGLE
jgi:transcription initiation factor TFIID subunit 13